MLGGIAKSASVMVATPSTRSPAATSVNACLPVTESPTRVSYLVVSGYYPVHTPRTPARMRVRRLPPSSARPGVVMRRAGPSRSSQVAPGVGVGATSPGCPRAWWALLGWQPKPGPGVRGSSAAAGPGGGVSGAPVPVFPQLQPAPVAFPNSGGPSQRRVEARHCARLPALIATLPSPDREIVLLRVVAGVSLPDVVAALGVTPAAIQLAHRHALSALQPSAPAPLRSPAIRGRVVLLPHARTAPTDT